ncbi:MAG: HEAT repeat domain-containing protein [Merismopedia sp. SIO2A8]|nr:HEAT repeat domain-containing protein [Merismopedia sp. SIO2A8]
MSTAENGQSGEQLTIGQAIANIRGDDLGLRVYAAWWLGRFRVNDPEAVDVLIGALADEDDRTDVGGYPLRRNAARALGKLGDRRAVEPLIASLSCSDFYVREAAARSLETLGDSTSIPRLIALLNGEIEGTLPAPEMPDLAEPYDAILEALGTLNADKTVPLIKPFLDHDIPRIQYAAARALYQLSASPEKAAQYGNILIKALEGDELQLRRAALADLGAIGYLGAADAIAETLAENSLKLIALKGVLEKQVQSTIPTDDRSASELSEGAIHVMELMDSLL